MKRALILAVLVFCAARASLPASEITIESVIAEMNRCRIERGFAPYTRDKRLEAAASDRMNDMEELGYWAHVSPDGRSPFSWIPLHGYEFRAAGENLAGGFETAELLVTSWMESRGHRANILSPDFRSVGIAIIDGSPTGRAMGKSVVVLFAAEIVQPVKRKGIEN